MWRMRISWKMILSTGCGMWFLFGHLVFYIEIICIFVRCELKQIEIWVARFTLLVYRILRNSVEVAIFILIKRHWFINWWNRELLYLKSAAPFWQKSAYFYAWSLLSRKAGTLWRAGYGEAGKDWVKYPILHLDLNTENTILRKVWRINWMGRWWNGRRYMAKSPRINL